MPDSDIVIKGAREHNLRDVDVVLPRDQLICLTGVSGSGKSSLAFDTVYAEGQRRYVESLSSFARQFLGQMPKPDVDLISGLSPSISISQKSAGNNPRSTVGTITEIYDFLRVLYARVGDGHCPRCERPITAQSREQIIERILSLPKDTRILILAPVIRGQKGEHKDLFEDYLKQGYARARVDGEVASLNSDLQLDRQMRHDIEIVVDRLVVGPSIRGRLSEAVEGAIKIGSGNLIVAPQNEEPRSTAKAETKSPTRRRKQGGRGKASTQAAKSSSGNSDIVLSIDYACTECGISFEPPSPQLFSFNSPQGMCLECDGLGEVYSFDVDRLIPDPGLSIKKGCFELVGPWKKLGRWKRHIYKGVANTMERILGLKEDALITTPWKKLDPEHQRLWLWGTGETNITYTWRGGKSPMMYGGTFAGIIPELLDKYRSCKSRILLRKLEQYMSTIDCPDCSGKRLNAQACAVTVTTTNSQFRRGQSKSLPEICNLPVSDAIEFFAELKLDETRQIVASEVLKEIRGRLGFLHNVGLTYLTLDRTAPTLSGGESQRIRLAGQIGCGLVGVLYILDEPSIGLHPRDNDRLIDTLCELRDLGNTVVVVEHDEDTMRASDHVIDFGPGPGVRGGEQVVAGTLAKVKRSKRSVTGQFLSGKRQIEIPESRRLAKQAKPKIDEQETEPAKLIRGRKTQEESPTKPGDQWLSVLGAAHNNLKGIDVHIPLGSFVCVTGVSGSGKSSMVSDILIEALRERLNNGAGDPGDYQELRGLQYLDKMIAIDQSPIGRTPRSNPGTYIKLFDEIRSLFTKLPAAKQRGYKPGRFSFNVEGGRCEACEGNGSTRLEMDFLADVWVTCPICQGHRFNRETLGVKFKDHSIADVLEMDIQQAIELFENIPKIHHKLQTLHDVGLDYLKIGQPSPTLSGGEAQRIKLARELVKKSTGRTLYMLDEPTTGLHFADIELLLKVLHRFVDAGNTVVVVEHNLDVIKTADWVIDLGPEGGEAGGQVVVAGPPEKVAASKKSYTGRALARVLKGESGPAVSRAKPKAKRTARRRTQGTQQIVLEGASQHNLKSVDVRLPREKMSTFCGPSGSGKSSLAMDTIYAEGQRRYVESLSSYARQFVSQMQKPQMERIEGLSPAIAIEQQNLGSTPRSTVGTSTEIYDYLRILFARLGSPHCPDCQIPVGTQSVDEVVDKIMSHPEGTKLFLMAPVSLSGNQTYDQFWEQLRSEGFHRIRVNDKTGTLDDPPRIDRRRRHRVEVIVDRIVVRKKSRSRIAESIEVALGVGQGVLNVAHPDDAIEESEWRVDSHSQHRVCEECGRSFEALTPHSFSFNSHLGWCDACEGLGTEVGANPAALFRSRELTLAEGAILIWPDVSRDVSQWMLAALGRQSGIPSDVPFDQLDARQRRKVFQGTGDKWHDVYRGGKPRGASSRPLFRFQFKGLYPALEHAARLSPSLRTRLMHLVGEVDCSVCAGSRVREDAAAVRFADLTIDQLCRQPMGQLQKTIANWSLTDEEKRIAGELLREIRGRVQFLNDVGLEYLTLSRTAATLSGGEAQRIRLASQLGSGLCGVLYVLDEPTIGLHPRDNHRLLGALHKLRDLGNTLVLVEHDREVISGSDHIVDFGPGAGREGGQVVAQGTPAAVPKRKTSVTGPYLSGKKAIPIPNNRRISGDVSPLIHAAHQQIVDESKSQGLLTQDVTAPQVTRSTKKAKRKKKVKAKQSTSTAQQNIPELLTILGARHNNLKSCHVSIPLGALTAITGVSGSGKSSLMNDVLYNELARTLHRASLVGGPHDRIVGLKEINKVVRVDQQPLGNSPTSNPATYTGVFELIRTLFAQLPEAKLRGYAARRFSFNVPGGRCEECEGNGQQCIEMHFLPDVWVPCETCQGRRYNLETLEVKFHGHSVADVLEMTCGEALKLFKNLAKIRRILQTLCDVGLDYLTLGQAAPTLSGGEAQRVKLAAELARPDTGRTLYLLDEPTTGLHFDDLAKLLNVLNRLVDLGNTVVVIEHNLDVIKTADWVIDMGPEAGEQGGYVTASGTPEEVVEAAKQAAQSKQKLTAKRPTNGSAKRKTARRKTKPESPDKTPFVSLTGVALTDVLAAGPHEERKVFDLSQMDESLDDDVEIKDVGRQAKMPWELNGPRWHTKDRVGRNGEPCHWDGRILAEVIDRIEKRERFSDTGWNSRTIVEVAAKKKSHGWFLHAITGENWLLKLKFRTSKKAFRKDELLEQIPLRTLNEMDDLPIYGNDPRVKVRTLRGPWQEAEFRLNSWEETDRPEFWQFLETAMDGFLAVTEKVAANPDELMPWKKLGKRWHLSPRGFPVGKKPSWDAGLLDRIFDMLSDVSSGEYQWTNQKIVHLHAKNKSAPWATVSTKRVDGVEVALTGPKGQFGLGRITPLCENASIDSQKDRDVMRLVFDSVEQLEQRDLQKFLNEHFEQTSGA